MRFHGTIEQRLVNDWNGDEGRNLQNYARYRQNGNDIHRYHANRTRGRYKTDEIYT